MDQIINSSITITTPMLECSLYLLHIGLFQVLVIQWRYPFYHTVCIDFDFKRLENNIPCLFCSWWLICTQFNKFINSLINTNTVGNNLALQSFVACHHWKMKQYCIIQVLFGCNFGIFQYCHFYYYEYLPFINSSTIWYEWVIHTQHISLYRIKTEVFLFLTVL